MPIRPNRDVCSLSPDAALFFRQNGSGTGLPAGRALTAGREAVTTSSNLFSSISTSIAVI
jgi:hypothetical protein